jgi:hypothetical protein
MNIPVSDFVDLRDDNEGEEDEETVVFRRKRKTVEDDDEEDAQAQAKHAKKGKGKRHVFLSSFWLYSYPCITGIVFISDIVFL